MKVLQKNKANSGVRFWRFYRSSTRLPVFGCALLCGVVFIWAPDSTRGWNCFFGRRMTGNVIFREMYKGSVTPSVLRSITDSPQPGWFK